MEEETFWRQRFMRLETFNKILKAATSSAYLNTAFARMSEEINLLLQHDKAVLYFGNIGSDFAVSYADTGGKDAEGVGSAIPLAGSTVGEVIKTGAPKLRYDIAKGDDFVEKDMLTRLGIRSTVTVPVWRGESPVGILCFGSFEVDKYGDAEVQTALEIADLVGDILTKSRDMQELLNLKSAHLGMHNRYLKVSSPLTARETQVLTLLADGGGNKGIAEHLGINLRTVRFHIENIYQKLGVQNRIQALREAQENHLINI